MGIVKTGESEWEKEEAKWNTPKRLGGMAPDGYEPFPAMLYKAQKKANGKVLVIDIVPNPTAFLMPADYERAALSADTFNVQNQRIVKNQAEKDRAVSEGWRDSPQEALDFFERLEEEMGRAAAETNFAVQRMSAAAREEHRIATDATHEHIADVPVPPKRKRGRPAKATANA